MKRLIPILLAALLLCACLPTPEQEFVVNKGDNTVEQKINATQKPVENSVQANPGDTNASAAPTDAPVQEQHFPDRWDEDAETVNDHLTIAVHADVITKADGLYPVYRTKEAPLTEAEATELTAKLLSKPKEAYISEMTKDDWKKSLQDYLDTVAEQQAWVDAGKPDWGDRDETVFTPEEIEEQTNWYMEQIKNAPDKLETKSVSDYSGIKMNSQTVYTLESGGKAYVSFYRNGLNVSIGCTGHGYVYYDYFYEEDKRDGEPNAKRWKDVTLSQEDAEATLNSELMRLGFEDYSVFSATKANLLDTGSTGSAVAAGWSFRLRRNSGNYPTIDVPWEPSQFLQYGQNEGFTANAYISPEELELFIGEDGLCSFGFYNRKEIVGLPNANVELLPFERVQQLAKNGLTAGLTSSERGQDREINIEVYRMMLTTYTLHVKDSDEYYEMPCWVVFFDGMWGMDNPEWREKMRSSKDMMQDALVLNAVDGSIVHTDYGF